MLSIKHIIKMTGINQVWTFKSTEVLTMIRGEGGLLNGMMGLDSRYDAVQKDASLDWK